MKRILSLLISILMLTSALQTVSTAEDDRILWATASNGNAHLMPADYDKTVKAYERGKFTESRTYSCWAWKNDYTGSRLDFLTLDQDIPGATLVTEDLVSKDGDIITRDNITATFIGKVNTLSKAYPGIDYEVFDVITHKSMKDMAAGQIHQAWVDIRVPRDAAAGTYTTTVS